MVYKGNAWTAIGTNLQYLNNLYNHYEERAQYHLSRFNYYDKFPDTWNRYSAQPFASEFRRRAQYHQEKYFILDGKAQSILWQIQAIEGGI